MEQRNKSTVSLRTILMERYMQRLIHLYEKESNEILTIDKIEGETLEAKINTLLKKVTKQKVDLKNFIDYQSSCLFEMLDVFLGDSKSKLYIPSDDKRYAFNEENAIFINLLLDLKDNKDQNYICLKNRRLKEIDVECFELFYRGLLELAKNPNNSLTEDEVTEAIYLIRDLDFEKAYDLVKDLQIAMVEYLNGLGGKKDTKGIYTVLGNVVSAMIYMIEINKSPGEFPDIDFNDIDRQRNEMVQKAEERSARAKQGWETRRNNSTKN